MRKKIMTLMMGALLLLTACGQTGSNSASTMLPVAAVQSAAQAIAPMEDKAQEDVDSLPAEEGVEEVKGADDKETPNPAEDADTPSAKTEETSTTPAGEGQSDAPEPPAAPKQPVTPAPEDKPAPAPTPAPTQKPAEKQEEDPAPAPTPEPVPAPEPKPEPADRWAAVSAANAYAVTQYGVITDGSLTLDNSAYRFPAAVICWYDRTGRYQAMAGYTGVGRDPVKAYIKIKAVEEKGSITVRKVVATGAPLAGAELMLETSADGKTWTEVSRITTDKTGIAKWSDLKIGVQYRITETKAPAGYTLLTEPLFTGTLDSNNRDITITACNNAGFVLPFTGGMGFTTYIVLAALMLCMGVYFCKKSNIKKEKTK